MRPRAYRRPRDRRRRHASRAASKARPPPATGPQSAPPVRGNRAVSKPEVAAPPAPPLDPSDGLGSGGGGAGTAVAVGIGETAGEGVGVTVERGCVGEGTGVNVGIGEGVGVGEGTGVSVGVATGVGVHVGNGVGVGPGVGNWALARSPRPRARPSPNARPSPARSPPRTHLCLPQTRAPSHAMGLLPRGAIPHASGSAEEILPSNPHVGKASADPKPPGSRWIRGQAHGPRRIRGRNTRYPPTITDAVMLLSSRVSITHPRPGKPKPGV